MSFSIVFVLLRYIGIDLKMKFYENYPFWIFLPQKIFGLRPKLINYLMLLIRMLLIGSSTLQATYQADDEKHSEQVRDDQKQECTPFQDFFINKMCAAGSYQWN